jgi:hypothetical protein
MLVERKEVVHDMAGARDQKRLESLGPYEPGRLRKLLRERCLEVDWDSLDSYVYDEYLVPPLIGVSVICGKDEGDVMLKVELWVNLDWHRSAFLKLRKGREAEAPGELERLSKAFHVFLTTATAFKLEPPNLPLIAESPLDVVKYGLEPYAIYYPRGEAFEDAVEDTVAFVVKLREHVLGVKPPHGPSGDERERAIVEYLGGVLAEDLGRGVSVRKAGFRTLTLIGDSLGLPRSTAHRLLGCLAKQGYVEHVTRGGYRLRLDAGITYVLLFEKGYWDAYEMLVEWLWRGAPAAPRGRSQLYTL